MPDSSPHPWLGKLLRDVPRRYRLPPLDAPQPRRDNGQAASALAVVIEQTRQTLAHGQQPDDAAQRTFIDALARMIRHAIDPASGDPAFQAMVLRHGHAQVGEYAALSANARRDRRRIHAAVNAIAHPAKQDPTGSAEASIGLARLHACAAQGSWNELAASARALFNQPEVRQTAILAAGLSRILDDSALNRLRRREALASNDLVRRYQALWERQGPRSGSLTAAAQGASSRRRGAAVETLAAKALSAMAQQLNAKDAGRMSYRVVTSLRVPAALPGNAERAKSEWDAALLQRPAAAVSAWDVCLLVEAKASVDAATTDLPRLLRGLRLLAQAQEDAVYSFACREGTIELRGAALRALPTEVGALSAMVLYCSNAAAEAAPRLLNAAHRMQLLSTPVSLEYAGALMAAQPAQPRELTAVWRLLLESPAWQAVLRQYSTLHQVRELMVHADDLLAAAHHT